MNCVRKRLHKARIACSVSSVRALRFVIWCQSVGLDPRSNNINLTFKYIISIVDYRGQ